MNLFDRIWWEKAGVRALKTMAETALAVLGSGLIGVLDVDWLNLFSVVMMSGVTSMLVSVKGLPELSDDQIKRANADFTDDGLEVEREE